MRFVDIKEPGDVSGMVIGDTEIPQLGAGDVLIKVAYAGVNRPDVIQRLGLYPPPPGASPILGLEVSGVVAGVGSEVDKYRLGDEVCALTNGGGYAEYVTAAQGQCLPKPAGLSLAEAAALPETCFTVWANLFDRGRLQAGDTALIHGGGSGIGTTAIQMAKGMGATVFVTASSEQKCRACLDLGADAAIDYSSEDFVERVMALSNHHGADVILDMVGGDYIERNMQVAAVEGRIVNIAYLRGPQVQVNFMPVMLKRLTMTGSTLRPQSAQAKASIGASLEANIWPLIAAGKIKPVMAAEFPLERAAEAHSLMESNTVIGKIVLAVG